MIVEEIMKTQLVTLFENHKIADAVKLMKENHIRHIPIIDQTNTLIGIVSDRDIRDASPSIFMDQVERNNVLDKPLKSIMKTDIITGHPLDFVEEVAAYFYEYQIGSLPIVKDHKIVGIITETDLLHTLVELTGAHQPGSQIEILVSDQPGILSEITTIFGNRKANILSILVYPYKKTDQMKVIVVRVQTMNPTGLIKEINDAGYKVLWPNLPEMNI
jgi:acetoin utilization protein AcuB